ncbi:MAG: RlmE family RNA methyltransferase, partial [Polyangiales bacterium]
MARGGSGRSGKNPYAKPDVFAQKAKKEGYPARSVYKLEEIDRRVHLLRPGQHVLDLGCAPGSWLMYVAQKIAPGGRARGVDLTPLQIALPRHAESIVGDAFTPTAEVEAFIRELAPYQVLLSDMAPSTTGDRFRDQMRSADLVDRTLDLAEQL